MKDKPLVIFGSGEEVRDFIFVKDLVEAHNICLERDDLSNDVFNVCSGKGVTLNQLAEMVLKMTGKNNLEIIHEDVSNVGIMDRRRLPFIWKTMVCSNKKAESVLGWKPKTTLEEGLRIEYEWLKEHKDRWWDKEWF